MPEDRQKRIDRLLARNKQPEAPTMTVEPIDMELLREEGEGTVAFARRMQKLHGKKDFGTAWEELKDNPSRLFGIVSGAVGAVDLKRTYSDVQDWEAGNATDEQKRRILLFAIDQQRETSGSYTFGTILADAPAFMQEYALTGGMATLGKKGSMKMLTRALKEKIKDRATRKMTTKVLDTMLRKVPEMMVIGESGSALASQFMEGDASGGRIAESTWAKALPGLGLVKDEETEQFLLLMDDTMESFWEAAPRGAFDHWVELVSENAGPLLSKLPGLDKMRAMQLKVLGDITPEGKSLMDTMRRGMQKGGFNGVWEEWGEERLGGAMRAAAPGMEDDWSDVFPSLENGIAEIMAFGVMGAAPAAAGKGLSLATDKISQSIDNKNYVEIDPQLQSILDQMEAEAGIEQAGGEGALEPTLETTETTEGTPSPAPLPTVKDSEIDPANVPARVENARRKMVNANGQEVQPATPEDIEGAEGVAALITEGKTNGKTIVPMKGSGKLKNAPAMFPGEGVILIDIASVNSKDPTQTFKALLQHETIHDLWVKDPKRAKELLATLKEVAPILTGEKAREYEAKAEAAGIKMTPEVRAEEGVAEMSQQLFPVIEYLNTPEGQADFAKYAGENRSAARKLIDFIKELLQSMGLPVSTSLDKALESLRKRTNYSGPEDGVLVAQAVATALGDVYRNVGGKEGAAWLTPEARPTVSNVPHIAGQANAAAGEALGKAAGEAMGENVRGRMTGQPVDKTAWRKKKPEKEAATKEPAPPVSGEPLTPAQEKRARQKANKARRKADKLRTAGEPAEARATEAEARKTRKAVRSKEHGKERPRRDAGPTAAEDAAARWDEGDERWAISSPAAFNDILSGKEDLKAKKDKPGKRSSVSAMGYATEDRAKRLGYQVADPKKLTADELEAVAVAMASEIEFQVGRDSDAVGWYDRKVKAALKLLSVYFPEIEASPDSRAVFTVILAVTSNGQDVYSNFKGAVKAYMGYAKTGKIPKGMSFGGERQKEIRNALKTIQGMIDRDGIPAMREFLEAERSVSEFKKLGWKVNDEAAYVAPGSIIFGPKLGSFYGNLNGDYTRLTADVWFTRTYNRIIGWSAAWTPESVARKRENLRAVIREAKGTDGKAWRRLGVRKADLLKDDAALDAFARAKEKELSAKGVSFDYDKLTNPAGPKAMYVKSNGLVKELKEPMHGLPRGVSERGRMRAVTTRAQELLAAEEIHIDIADMQAVLWYHEKDLYTQEGAANERGAGADYEDAAKRAIEELGLKPAQPAARSGVQRGRAGDGKRAAGKRGKGSASAASGDRFALAPPTDSPAFAKWFGDSKVVDAEGEPLVVYHNTWSVPFTVFKPRRARNFEGGWASKAGLVYFSEQPDSVTRSRDAGMSVYLSVQNPWDWRNPDHRRRMADHLELVGVRGMSEREHIEKTLEQGGWNLIEQYAIDWVKEQGFDGIAMQEGPGHTTWAVFSPTQIKSATGNRGTYDPADPDIRHALGTGKRRAKAARKTKKQTSFLDVELASEDKRDFIRRSMQDEFIFVRRLEQLVEKAKDIAISAVESPYAALGRVSAKMGAKAEYLERTFTAPITEGLKALHKVGVTLEQFEQYIIARHAPSRNAVIAERHPIKFGDVEETPGSGMATSVAKSIIDEVENGPNAELMKETADKLVEMNQWSLNQRLANGLISKKQYDTYSKQWDFYIPFKTEQSSEERFGGKGMGVSGKEFKTAHGRDSLPDHPIQFSIQQAGAAIKRGQKNVAANAFYNFIKKHADAVEWTEERPEDYVHLSKEDQDRGLFKLKVDGQQVIVSMSDANLSRALNRLGAEPMGKYLGAMSKAARIFSAMRTSYSPDFLIPNFFRDLTAAGIVTTAEESKELAGRVTKGVFAAQKQIWQATGGKVDAEFEEFQQAGGMVGWYYTPTIEEETKRLQRAIADADPSTARAMALKLIAARDLVDRANKAVENGVRFSLYKELRKMGKSKEEAADTARGITVDFTKKGEITPVFNTLFVFSNASIQGSARLLKALYTTKRGRAIAGGLVAAGFAHAIGQLAAAGDDDDGENFYMRIPAQVRNSNIVILTDDAGHYMKIPLPYGFSALWAAGQEAATAAFGGKDAGDAGIDAALAAADSFNPVGTAASVWQFFSPTVLDPFVQLATNENWAGSPIMPEDKGYGLPTPDSQRYFKSVSVTSKAISQWVNEATGGDEIQGGAIDISPETLDHWFDFIGGGTGKAIKKTTVDIPSRLISGELPVLNEVPVLRRVYASQPEWFVAKTYYENREAVDMLEARIENAKERGRGSVARDLRNNNRKLWRIRERVADTDKKVKELRKKARESKPERAQKYLDQLNRLQRRMNKRFKESVTDA